MIALRGPVWSVPEPDDPIPANVGSIVPSCGKDNHFFLSFGCISLQHYLIQLCSRFLYLLTARIYRDVIRASFHVVVVL